MYPKFLLPLWLCLLANFLFAQSNIQQTLSINNSGTVADGSAQLDVSASDKGMLVPRMTSAQRIAIAAPATGLLVFDTDTGSFWFYNGTIWTSIISGSNNDADADPTNEIQTLSKVGNTVSLSNGGGSFTDAVDDADADPTNEIQTLSKVGNTVSLSNGGGSFTDAVDDADADPNNEGSLSVSAGTATTSIISSNTIGSVPVTLQAGANIILSETGNTITIASAGGAADGNGIYSGSGVVPVGTSITLTNSLNFDAGTLYLDGLNDRIGMGISSPLTRLHVENGGILFRGTTGATPTTGAGTRLMWVPAKKAFRAGEVASTQWDDANLGSQSFVGGGLNNLASGNASFIGGGTGLYARSFGETVFGTFNLDYVPVSTTAIDATDRLFVIGNGTTDLLRANALTILKNGNIGVSTISPSQKLQVSGNIYASGGDVYCDGNNGVINAGCGNFNALVNVIADEVPAPVLTVANGDEDLYIQDVLEVGNNGYKPGGGVWAAISDARLKKDVAPYEDGLDKVLKIKPVRFKYNDVFPMHDGGREYVGVLAQDMLDIAPYTVKEMPLGQKVEEDQNGKEVIIDQGHLYYTYDGSSLTYMLINAVQELSKQVNDQKNMIHALQVKLEKLDQTTDRASVLELENEALKSKVDNMSSQIDIIKSALQGAGIVVEK